MEGDGSYVVGSHKPDDGLVLGRYGVSVEWAEQPFGAGYQGRNLIPTGYAPPELDIKADDIEPIPFDLDVPAGS